jgi:hypothetical protein
MKITDYSITMQDSQGRTVKLFINGDSINEAISSGASEGQAREENETNAFWHAVEAGLIGNDAWIAESEL